jgi:hypothetical protein
MKTAFVLVLVSMLWGLFACTPPASRGGLDSDNPASKLYAIRGAGLSGDRAYVPRLVEELEHDDPAVRMMAINALEKLTGQRMGYNPYAGPVQRQAAVDRWVQAVREGKFE